MGTTTRDTVLNLLVQSIRACFLNSNLTCYSQITSIGAGSIPLLGNSKPAEYTRTASLAPYTSSAPYTGECTSYGWLRTIPLQAHNEFHINNGSYSDFLLTFNMAQGFIGQANKAIDAMTASDTYLDGTYSNMNDLITADLSGVSLSLFFWGQDLIASGRVIDLANIDKFGSPAALLRTLSKNKALTKAANLALLAAGFSTDEIDSLVIGTEATVDQQKKLYSAFCIIMDTDLVDVMIGLNCQTKGLRTLADLLDPKMLFPRSYATLTAPTYNATPGPTNSKTYYLLYTGGEVTSYIVNNYGENLKAILPATLSAACDAFSSTMLQIKNIKSMNIEKFSQVVQNLETVSDLAVNGTNVPTNQTIRNSALPLMALGNGVDGKYTTCDFFGAMSGLSYDWVTLEGYINSLATSKLARIYRDLYTAITQPVVATDTEVTDWDATNALVLSYINEANIEIAAIAQAAPALAVSANKLYNMFGRHLTLEQNARSLGLRAEKYLPDLSTIIPDVYGFMESLNSYATQTDKWGPVQNLEAISDTNTVGGNSMIGGMREVRNAHRLGLTGAEQDNEVGAEKLILPRINGLVPTTTKTDPVTGNIITVPLITTGPLVGVPIDTSGPGPIDSTNIGAIPTPYTLANPNTGNPNTSPWTTLVPSPIDIISITPIVKPSIITPALAIDEVILCNCDCWDHIM
jgi:hypothetical protein